MARPSISPIAASTISMAKKGRAGSGVTRPGATIGQTTRVKAIAAPRRTRAGIICSPKPGRSGDDAADADEDEDEAGEPGLGQVEEGGEAVHQMVRPEDACRADGQVGVATTGRAAWRRAPILGEPQHGGAGGGADLLEGEHRVADALGGQHRVQEAPAAWSR